MTGSTPGFAGEGGVSIGATVFHVRLCTSFDGQEQVGRRESLFHRLDQPLRMLRLLELFFEREEVLLREVHGGIGERGFDAVSVDDLMKAAGFTHGGFYNHFASKAELLAEASAAGIAEARGALVDSLRDPRKDAWERFVRDYLSTEHRGDPACGCTLGALAADAGRRGLRCRRALQRPSRE